MTRPLTDDEITRWRRTTVDPVAHWEHLCAHFGDEAAEDYLVYQLVAADALDPETGTPLPVDPRPLVDIERALREKAGIKTEGLPE